MPFIWFGFFDVGLWGKSVSIETILSLMQQVKSCVSEKLVYVTFWNLKGGLGKKNDINCTEICILSVAAPTALTQWTISASLHCTQHMEKPAPFTLQAASSWERTVTQRFPTPAEFGPSDTVPREGFCLCIPPYAREESCLQQVLCLDPKSQKPDHPHLTYSWWFF